MGSLLGWKCRDELCSPRVHHIFWFISVYPNVVNLKAESRHPGLDPGSHSDGQLAKEMGLRVKPVMTISDGQLAKEMGLRVKPAMTIREVASLSYL